jgi:hypothetical protein
LQNGRQQFERNANLGRLFGTPLRHRVDRQIVQLPIRQYRQL